MSKPTLYNKREPMPLFHDDDQIVLGGGDGIRWLKGDPLPPHFDGETFDPELDGKRLGAQQRVVMTYISDGKWYTLAELSLALGYPEASISARLRDCRKPRCGARTVERRRRGDPKRGLHEYRLVP